jgi:hypothetical protein
MKKNLTGHADQGFNFLSNNLGKWASILVAERDAALGEIVGRQRQGDFVTGHDLDEISAHFSRRISGDLVAVVHLNGKAGVRQGFGDGPLDLDLIFFWHYFLSVFQAGAILPTFTPLSRFFPMKNLGS